MEGDKTVALFRAVGRLHLTRRNAAVYGVFVRCPMAGLIPKSCPVQAGGKRFSHNKLQGPGIAVEVCV